MTDDLRPEGVHAPMAASLPAPMVDNLTPVYAPEPALTEAIGAQPMPTTQLAVEPTVTPTAPVPTATPVVPTTQPTPDTDLIDEAEEEPEEEAPIGRPSLCGRLPGWQRRKTLSAKPMPAAKRA